MNNVDVCLGQGLPRIPNEVLPWSYHHATVYLVMAACIGSFVAACNTPPGVVRVVRNEEAAVAGGAGGAGGASRAGGAGGVSSPRGQGRATGEGGRGQKRRQQQQVAGGPERGAGRRGAGEGGGRHAGLYPHDGVVFVEGFCKTCRVVK